MIGYLAAGLVSGVIGVSALAVVARRLVAAEDTAARLAPYALAGLALTLVGVQLVTTWRLP